MFAPIQYCTANTHLHIRTAKHWAGAAGLSLSMSASARPAIQPSMSECRKSLLNQVAWAGAKWEVVAAVGGLKGTRDDWLVEKAAELGAWSFQPLLTHRARTLGTACPILLWCISSENVAAVWLHACDTHHARTTQVCPSRLFERTCAATGTSRNGSWVFVGLYVKESMTSRRTRACQATH